MTQRVEPFYQWDSKNLTFFEHDSQNWTFFGMWLQELNPSFSTWLNELNPFFKIQRNEQLFSAWLKELNLTQGLNFFSNMTRRIEHFVECDSKNWTLFTKDSKNWTFFEEKLIQRIELFLKIFWLKEFFKIYFCDLGVELFFNLNQRINTFSTITQKWLTLFWTWLTETFLHFHSKNLFFFYNMIQNSKKWTIYWQMSRRLYFLLEICL